MQYQPPLVGRSEHRYGHRYGVIVQQRDFPRYALRSLVRTVHEEIGLSQRICGEMEYQREAAAPEIEFAVPRAEEPAVLCACGGRKCDETQ